jgi:hypothetical protein
LGVSRAGRCGGRFAFPATGEGALLYAELYRTLMAGDQFLYADLVQVQGTNARMVRDLERVGAEPYKRHRSYVRWLGG